MPSYTTYSHFAQTNEVSVPQPLDGEMKTGLNQMQDRLFDKHTILPQNRVMQYPDWSVPTGGKLNRTVWSQGRPQCGSEQIKRL